jgi:ribonuclease HI
MELIVQTDGASRGNPGPASYGFLIRDKETKEVIYQEGKTIGVNTNNIAEYLGVLRAFEYIDQNIKDVSKVEVVADSQLIIRQLAGFYRVKNPKLKILFDQIKLLELNIGEVSYRHVLRAFNKEADKLANLALDN